ncbi:MAG TPA: Fe-S cluster assembly protein SufD [Candidatus Polarisedimenticolia bacterium]|jgi:Fe-S cluster assembly protein SufD
MIGVTQDRDAATAAFARLWEKTPSGGRSWVDRVRTEAMARFSQLGFPTTRDEEWKKTSVAPIARSDFRLPEPAPVPASVDADSLERLTFRSEGCAVMVFINGSFAPTLSRTGPLPEGVRAGSLAAACETAREVVEPHLSRYATSDGHAFTALNTAFLRDGAFIYVPDGCVVPRPIHVVFVTIAPETADGAPVLMLSPRVLVVAGRAAEMTLVESYASAGPGRYFTNAVTEMAIGRDASVDHYKLQREADEAWHVAVQQAHLEGTARLASHSISLGGGLVRNESNVVLAVEGAQCALNGLYLAGGRQHVDNHTLIDHVKPGCVSREVYKGVLDGRARGVFNGKVIVRPLAARTDSKQANRNLLLSDEALVDTKPELQIFNNDVKCTHAAAIGQLDETAIFYLRSRGLGREAARSILIHAFVSEIIGGIKVAPLRGSLEALMMARLPEPLPAGMEVSP